jgi:hypothetical protein
MFAILAINNNNLIRKNRRNLFIINLKGIKQSLNYVLKGIKLYYIHLEVPIIMENIYAVTAKKIREE